MSRRTKAVSIGRPRRTDEPTDDMLQRISDLMTASPEPSRRRGEMQYQESEGLIKCPDPTCDDELPEDDLRAQTMHITSCHPEIVAARQREIERLAGWE